MSSRNFGSIALHKALLETKKIEFLLEFSSYIYELMNIIMITNHAHARTNPAPLEGPESKKIGFVAPIVASAEISKTINMLSKHGTTNVNDNKIK